jgi:DNA-binding beta-propeller fold protein YncE
MSLLLMAGSLALGGCGGDTLYDATTVDIDPPVVEVTSPADGAQVQAGQRVPIQVTATDAEGVSSIVLRITGAVSEIISLQFAPPLTEVQADTAITVPDEVSGNIQIAATGVNTFGVEGQAQSVVLFVSTVDGLPPSVSLSVESAPRMELTDSIRVTVRAYDNPGGSGVASTGLTAIVTNTSRSDTLVLSPSEPFSGPASDTAVSHFSFTPPFVDPLNLPDTLRIKFFGIGYDREGNCSGSVGVEFTDGVPCSTVAMAGGTHVIANAVAKLEQIIAVSGRTSVAPGGGVLADLLVDDSRSRVYVSNLSRNRIQTLEAETGSWGSKEVWVAAEPWGLAINLDGDTLFVANSGSNSISFVSLEGDPEEDLDRRYVTQNNALWEVEIAQGVLSAKFLDFSDRPQFLAQDAAGRLLYSTRPTPTAGVGTIRVVSKLPDWEALETYILVAAEDVVSDQNTTSIVAVDSVFSAADGSCVQIWDHKPGFPSVNVSSGCLWLDDALAAMDAHRAAGDSDIWYAKNSKWGIERLAHRDTTFVATSGDREWVAFGEGGTDDEAGRITLWDSDRAAIHSRLLVEDLLNNASEQVTGLDLNIDGTLGSASGNTASYYWSTDLRLQGSVTKTVPGGAGAVLHPSLPSFTPSMPSSDQTLSFVGQADYTIRILDTTHFAERGQIHIRDLIVGPLKAGPPLPSDNGGLGSDCVGDDCVVLKLYAITDVSGVVVVDVHQRDISEL